MNAIVSLAEIAPAQSSFVYDVSQAHAVALTPEVEDMLRANCVVAIGVSGGKDSVACALAVARHLDNIGQAGPRLLIHSDLGKIEWRDSLPSCERLALHLAGSSWLSNARLAISFHVGGADGPTMWSATATSAALS